MKNHGTTGLSARTVATVGMLCAIAFVAKLISNVFPTVSGFLSFDLKDVVIVIGGFMMGPMTAVAISVVVSLIEMLTISSTGFIGLVMNILSSCAFAAISAVIYRRKHSMKGAITGLVAGVLCTTVIMMLWNWLITPLYMKVDRAVIVSMLLPVFLPFNLVKGGINATLAMLLYKPVVSALRRAHLVAGTSGRGSTRVGVIAVSGVLLVSFLLLALVLAGVI